MSIVKKVEIIERAKSLIFENTDLECSEVAEMTIPEMIWRLRQIDDEPEAEALVNSLLSIGEEPVAYVSTYSDIGCIRLFNDNGEAVLFKNYVGDGTNWIYIIGKEENTEDLLYIARIIGEWYISEKDTENVEEAKITGTFDIYTDENRNFFFKKVDDGEA